MYIVKKKLMASLITSYYDNEKKNIIGLLA